MAFQIRELRQKMRDVQAAVEPEHVPTRGRRERAAL
jgi:hypothetical protein